MLVRGPTDLSELRCKLPVPERLAGRWAAVRLEQPGVFDFVRATIEVVAWIPVDDRELTWKDVADVLGAEQQPTTVTMACDAVSALVPDQFDEMQVDGAHVEVRGPGYPAGAFEGQGFGAGRAVRIEGGLLVAVTTI
ncbi:MAG TPA: hypothetical protein VM734_27945 [Kofleriaceae bacterium]|nr:hypothetical protein [Kofleriaceae bacterium]